ncbi:MAG: hypothetical protein JWM68_5526, partial [Verrucomicrobiales bacterium]|nr:hypothetical protein [Verrucomicrobiales bacterium]
PRFRRKIWIVSTSRTTTNYFFYDIDAKKVVGELLNGRPTFNTPDGKWLLCNSLVFVEDPIPLLKRTLRLFKEIKDRFDGYVSPRDGNFFENYWILNMENNSREAIGQLPQPSRSYDWEMRSWLEPSPDFRYAYTTAPFHSSNSPPHIKVVLCNMTTGAFETNILLGFPRGWWDEKNIVFEHRTMD